MSSFKTRTYGKWIFSGEHSVLRGGPALVFPLFKKKLELEYNDDGTTSDLKVKASGENANDIERLFPEVLAKALDLLKIADHKIAGTITFSNELPLGAGLGASSSLCVAFSRWFCFLKLLDESKIYEFSRQLENLFHGESSGVDIAVVLHEKPLVFQRPDQISLLEVSNKYFLYLSHTGQKGITKDCVNKVNLFLKSHPEAAQKIDEQMIKITQKAIHIFKQNELQSTKGAELIPIINAGLECFRVWGLTDGRVEEHISLLKERGALAAKPTGSGGGGYVLSLWPEKLNKNFDFEMIALFE